MNSLLRGAKHPHVNRFTQPIPSLSTSHFCLSSRITHQNNGFSLTYQTKRFINAAKFRFALEETLEDVLEKMKEPFPKGSQFNCVKLRYKDVVQVKRDRFRSEIVKFKDMYDKPIYDAMQEIRQIKKKEHDTNSEKIREERRRNRKPRVVQTHRDREKSWKGLMNALLAGEKWDMALDIDAGVDFLNLRGELMQSSRFIGQDRSVLMGNYGQLSVKDDRTVSAADEIDFRTGGFHRDIISFEEIPKFFDALDLLEQRILDSAEQELDQILFDANGNPIENPETETDNKEIEGELKSESNSPLSENTTTTQNTTETETQIKSKEQEIEETEAEIKALFEKQSEESKSEESKNEESKSEESKSEESKSEESKSEESKKGGTEESKTGSGEVTPEYSIDEQLKMLEALIKNPNANVPLKKFRLQPVSRDKNSSEDEDKRLRLNLRLLEYPRLIDEEKSAELDEEPEDLTANIPLEPTERDLMEKKLEEVYDPAVYLQYFDVDPLTITPLQAFQSVVNAFEDFKQRVFSKELEDIARKLIAQTFGDDTVSFPGRFEIEEDSEQRISYLDNDFAGGKKVYPSDDDVVRSIKQQLAEAGLLVAGEGRKRIKYKSKKKPPIPPPKIPTPTAERERLLMKLELQGLEFRDFLKETTDQRKAQQQRELDQENETLRENDPEPSHTYMKMEKLTPEQQEKYKELNKNWGGATETLVQLVPRIKDLESYKIPKKPSRRVNMKPRSDFIREEKISLEDLADRQHMEYERKIAMEFSLRERAILDAQHRAPLVTRAVNELLPEERFEFGDGGYVLDSDDVQHFFKPMNYYPKDHRNRYPIELIYGDYILDPAYREPENRGKRNMGRHGILEDLDGGYGFRHRKMIMRVNMRFFDLPPPVHERFVELAGPRYSMSERTLTLVGDNMRTRHENHAYLKKLFRNILQESWLADPNYVTHPTEIPEEVDEKDRYIPSQQVNKVGPDTPESLGFLLFRVLGYPTSLRQDTNKIEVEKNIDRFIKKPAKLRFYWSEEEIPEKEEFEVKV